MKRENDQELIDRVMAMDFEELLEADAREAVMFGDADE